MWKIREENGKKYVVWVYGDLTTEDMEALKPFAVPTYSTSIYIPFDPNTFTIPTDTTHFIERKIGDTRVVFSPNVYQYFMQNYVKTDSSGRRYFTEYPILVVDYNTPMGMLYSGNVRPRPRPLDQQIEDWKSGYQISRIKLDREEYFTFFAEQYYEPRYYLHSGYYLVKHQARLLSLPASIGEASRDVLKFYYTKPKNVLLKIPGAQTIVDYVAKHKLSNEGVQNLRKILQAFGYDIDPNATYTTDSGKTVQGITVEGNNDAYVVYIPVRKIGSLAIQVSVEVAVMVIVAFAALAVFAYYMYKVESEENKKFKIYLDAIVKAQENYNNCTQQCYNLPENERPDCLRKCGEAYSTTINTAQQSWKTASQQENVFGDIKDIIKWGTIAVIVVNVLPAFTSALRRKE